MTASVTTSWYQEPLDGEDLLAALSLLIPGLFFGFLYGLVAYVMWRNDREVIGFRFLASAAFVDLFVLFNYAIWPGATILFKSELVAKPFRPWQQLYMDWVWFTMCFHYVLVAWTRLAAIHFLHAFRGQSRRASYAFCGLCYLFALILVLCTHFQPWYVTFYYDPAYYGMVAVDFAKYQQDGQALMFLLVHVVAMSATFILYAWALVLLLRHRKHTGQRLRLGSANSRGPMSSASIETRLMFPCVCNSIVFIAGQLLITYATAGGKWGAYLVLVVFSANAALNPLLLLGFSSVLRRLVAHTLAGWCRNCAHLCPSLSSTTLSGHAAAVPITAAAPIAAAVTLPAPLPTPRNQINDTEDDLSHHHHHHHHHHHYIQHQFDPSNHQQNALSRIT